MSNMSYCRYTNTLSDLRDCYYDLKDRDMKIDGTGEYDEQMSDWEQEACIELLRLCRTLAEDFEEELDELDSKL